MTARTYPISQEAHFTPRRVARQTGTGYVSERSFVWRRSRTSEAVAVAASWRRCETICVAWARAQQIQGDQLLSVKYARKRFLSLIMARLALAQASPLITIYYTGGRTDVRATRSTPSIRFGVRQCGSGWRETPSSVSLTARSCNPLAP